MSKKEKMELVPQYRFPEFNKEWLNADLGALFSNRQEIGFLDLPLMSLTDEHGIIPQIDSNKKDNSNSDKSKYLRICNDDIVYNTMRMWQGRCAYATIEGIVSPAYTVCTPKENSIGRFFYYYFKINTMIKKFHANSQGLVSDTLSLKYNAFSKIEIVYPLQKLEQQKIADCLSSIAGLIAAEDKKLSALRAHKNGLMQKLFPAEGKTVPEWRFPEFRDTEEWSNEKVSSLRSGSLTNGVFNDPKNTGTGYKLINVKDMYTDSTIDENNLTLIGLSKDVFLANKVENGDVFFTRSSLVKEGIAQCNIYLGNSDDITFDGHLIRFKPNKNLIHPLFSYFLFKTGYARKQLIIRGKTATMTTIGQSDIDSVIVPLPTHQEQQKIAGCLSSFDDIITTQAEKIEILKAHKKGLMQGLFPSVAEANV